MANIITRAGKGAPLSWNEADANFINLNTDKVETSILANYSTTVKTDASIAAALAVHIDDAIDAHVSSAIGYLPAGTGAAVRNVQAKLREFVSVTDFGAVGDGVVDDTAAIQAAVNMGKRVYFPAPSVSYKLGSAINVTTQGQVLYGDGYQSFIYCPSGTAFNITTGNITVTDLRLKGGYVSGNRAFDVAGAQCKFLNLDVREFDVGLRWTSGFHMYVQNWHTRNFKTYGLELKNGVGAFISNVTYDTDGAWYSGSFTEPTAFLLINNEGNVIDGCDFIHPGIGVLIEPDGRNIEWNMFSNSYLSDSSQSGNGIVIRQSSNTYYIRGLFFDHCWAATNERGVLIDGTGSAVLDGVVFKDCMFHNNRHEGVRISKGVSLEFKDCEFAGNNSGGGSSNQFYANTVNYLHVDDCFFGNKFNWGSTPLYQVYIDTAATNVSINDCEFPSPGSSGLLEILNGTNTILSYDRWTLAKLVTISSGAQTNISDYWLGSFSEMMLVFDNVAHDSSGDLRISFSSDGGSTFSNIAFERLQFSSGTEGYQTYIDGGRTIASGSNLQGSVQLTNNGAGYKHITYNSNLNAASGQGLLMIGTVNSLASINYIRFYWSVGNLTSGTIRVFVK